MPMTTAVAERESQTADELAVFRKQDAIVADLRDKYMGLKIDGLNDRKGFDAVHDARMIVKRARVDVEKTREQLKKESLERGRRIDAEAKRVTALLAPIEEHLEAEETAVTTERERIKAAAEEQRKAKVKARFAALQALGYTGDLMAVPEMTDDEFVTTMGAAREAKAERDRMAEEERQRQAAEQARLKQLEEQEAADRAKLEESERQRLAAEAEERRKETERLAAERAELDRQRKAQDEEQASVRREHEAERAKIEAERRAVELEKAKQEAAQKAREEAEREHAIKVAREKAEAAAEAKRMAEKAKADEAVRLKAEAERPQRDKLIAVALAVLRVEVPDGPGHHAVCEVLSEAAERINDIAKGPLA